MSKNLLIVEDNEMAKRLLNAQVVIPLQREVECLEVTVANDADEGITLIRKMIFSVIVTDLDVPDEKSGLRVREEALGEQPATPVIIFTNKADLPGSVPEGVEVMPKTGKGAYPNLYRRIKEILLSLPD